jgi:dihydrofolate reductase
MSSGRFRRRIGIDGGGAMGKVRFSISMSIDGYIAGPSPSLESPLGEGGEHLHQWILALEAWRRPHGLEGGEVNESTPVAEAMQANVGAYLMGRNMFGGGPGDWGHDPWQGWWGDDPPFHAPVFVVTHHARKPLELQDTTFTFVTDGVEAALEQARAAAGDGDVLISGGASVVGQCLEAGAVDELTLSIAPVLLGGGTPLFGGRSGDLRLEQIAAVSAPGVAHVTYRVDR